MKYEVRCECGKEHAVTGADAGASLACDCGRTVEVPPLHELRSAAGEQVLSPILRLQSLLLDGKLPGTRRCGCCGQETDGRVQVVLDCDRATVKAGGPSRTDVAAGCLLSFGMGLILHMLRRNAPTKEFGQDVRATVPLPMCDSCRPALANSNTLRRSLLTIPEYAALLDQYPNARIAIRG